MNWNKTKIFNKEVSLIVDDKKINKNLYFLETNKLEELKLSTSPKTYNWKIPKINIEYFPNDEHDLIITTEFFHYKKEVSDIVLYNGENSKLSLNDYISNSFGIKKSNSYTITFNSTLKFMEFKKLKIIFNDNTESPLLKFNHNFEDTHVKVIKRFNFNKKYEFNKVIDNTSTDFIHYDNATLTKFHLDTVQFNINIKTLEIGSGKKLKPVNNEFLYVKTNNNILEISKSNLEIKNNYTIPDNFFSFDFMYGPYDNSFYFFKDYPTEYYTEIIITDMSFNSIKKISFPNVSLQESSIHIKKNILYGWSKFSYPPNTIKIDLLNKTLLFNKSHIDNVWQIGQNFLYSNNENLYEGGYNTIKIQSLNNLELVIIKNIETNFLNRISKTFIILESDIIGVGNYIKRYTPNITALLPKIQVYDKYDITLKRISTITFLPYSNSNNYNTYSFYTVSDKILLFGNGLLIKYE